MKKLLLSIATMFMLVTPTLADNFYSSSSGQWAVFGHTGSEDLNPACVMRTSWNDGSRMYIIQDLADGELYIYFENMKWNITGPYNKEHEMEIKFFSGQSVKALKASFNLTTNNNIHIRGIKHDMFLDPFVIADRMEFIMPGNIPDATIGLIGTRDAVEYLKGCVRMSNNVKLIYPNKRSSI